MFSHRVKFQGKRSKFQKQRDGHTDRQNDFAVGPGRVNKPPRGQNEITHVTLRSHGIDSYSLILILTMTTPEDKGAYRLGLGSSRRVGSHVF